MSIIADIILYILKMMKKITLTIFILLTITSCNKSNEINNMQENNFNNTKIYFLDNKSKEYFIEYSEINADNIPQEISLVHFWHKLQPSEVEWIFWLNLNFIDSPEIIISDRSMNDNIHKIFTQLDVINFNWLIHVYNDCDKWIKVWKNISDLYFSSQINNFNFYTVCSQDVTIPVSCMFEWEEENKDKVICG